MAPFTGIFGVAVAINLLATFRSSSYWDKYKHIFGFASIQGSSTESSLDEGNESAALKEKHTALLKKYLAVYLLAVMSDWLQGPYVYALYDDYGYSQHDIAVLFVAGFGSSMIFGTFIGGLVDSCGRKRFTIFFAVVYALSCITKHFNHFGVLMLGRLLGGIATSLLFSVFDAWLIRSHADLGISSYLSKSFATAQYGNSIVAILAGLVANSAAASSELSPFGKADKDSAILFKGGYLNPFDLALCALSICAVLAATLWGENYGETKGSEGEQQKPKRWHDAFSSAFFTTINSKEILYAGLICSLFEGSMFIFVFMWTPALQKLTADGESIPFGLVFATFMVACMAGSSLFSVLIGRMKNEKIGQYVFGGATAIFLIMAYAPTDTLAMVAFLLFELLVGCYFPMMGTMKSIIVPESKRAAIYNLYRIPLNFIVLFSLLTDLSPKQSFFLCTSMMATATFLQTRLLQHQSTFFTTGKNDTDDIEQGSFEEELLIPADSESMSETVDLQKRHTQKDA